MFNIATQARPAGHVQDEARRDGGLTCMPAWKAPGQYRSKKSSSMRSSAAPLEYRTTPSAGRG